jgi:hypothetical protein
MYWSFMVLTFQGYVTHGIAVHVLIWDPRGRVCDSSSLDGVHCVSCYRTVCRKGLGSLKSRLKLA